MSLSPSTELLKQLIAYASVSAHGNAEIARFVADRLAGCVDELHVLPTDHDGQVNLLARVGGQYRPGTRSGLLLSGHLDVVPAQEPGWTSPPFEPRLEGAADEARLFGRGACDMKAAIACFITTIKGLDKAQLDRPLWMLLSCNEEVGSLGVQHFAAHHAQRFDLPDQCIVGEPTAMRVVRMHKGHLKLRATYHGRSSHTGTPHLGVNAIQPVAQVVERITALQHAWSDQQIASGMYFADGSYPIVNIVGVRGGAAWNVMPDLCEIDIGVRLLPGMESQPAIDAVRDACDVAFAGGWELDVINDNPPLLIDAGAAVHVACCEAISQHESLGVPFASDGGVLKRDLDINCVLCGPGSMAVAHQADEFVPLNELDQYTRLLECVIQQMCGV